MENPAMTGETSAHKIMMRAITEWPNQCTNRTFDLIDTDGDYRKGRVFCSTHKDGTIVIEHNGAKVALSPTSAEDLRKMLTIRLP